MQGMGNQQLRQVMSAERKPELFAATFREDLPSWIKVCCWQPRVYCCGTVAGDGGVTAGRCQTDTADGDLILVESHDDNLHNRNTSGDELYRHSRYTANNIGKGVSRKETEKHKRNCEKAIITANPLL